MRDRKIALARYLNEQQILALREILVFSIPKFLEKEIYFIRKATKLPHQKIVNIRKLMVEEYRHNTVTLKNYCDQPLTGFSTRIRV